MVATAAAVVLRGPVAVAATAPAVAAWRWRQAEARCGRRQGDRDLVMCFECWLCCGPALSCWVCAHSRERGIESSMCLNRVRFVNLNPPLNERPRCQERPQTNDTRELSPLSIQIHHLARGTRAQCRSLALESRGLARRGRARCRSSRLSGKKTLQTRFTISAKV